MNVTYDDRVKQSKQDYALLQQASVILEEVLEQSAGLVKAEWDRTDDDKGRLFYSLRISDWTGGASTIFDLNELKSPERMRVRLYRLWGELLQARVDKAFQKLKAGGE